MKHKAALLILNLIIGISIQVKAQTQDGYLLTCQFKGLTDKSKVYLRTKDKDTVLRVLSDGDRFTFKGKLDPEGRFLFIGFDTLITKNSTKAIFVTNRSINVTGIIGSREIEIMGSPEQEDYKASQDLPNKFSQQMNESIRTINLKIHAVNNNVKLTKEEKAFEMKKINEESLKVSDSIELNFSATYKIWLIKHRESLYTPYALQSMFKYMKMEHVKQVFDSFPKRVQDSYYGKQIKETMDMAASSSVIKQGVVFPSLSVYNMDGKVEKLLDIIEKNKLTLIDCWASWCKPCRAEVPELKKIHAKYKNKGFGIIGISSDKDNGAWKKAVREDQTTWPHFIEDKTKLISKAFNLQAIPAYILVNSEGKMIAFDCAMSTIPNFGGGLRGESLEKKIEELLNEKGK